MEGEHAQMWQIPCKMTNSSSKPLPTLGKWYQPRKPKKIPKPAQKKIPKTNSHPNFCHGAGFEERKPDKIILLIPSSLLYRFMRMEKAPCH
jgi:hypothetical protein